MSWKSSDIVLVTGANGHLASFVVAELAAIPGGPLVRATVRSDSSARVVSEVFEAAIVDKRVEVVQVEDITCASAFDHVLNGVTHIAHIASPLVTAPKDIVKDLLAPAIKGTTGILEAASRIPSVRAIVVTSSFGAMFDPTKKWAAGYNYTAKDWAPMTEADAIRGHEAAARGEELPEYGLWTPYTGYCTSKVLAEKAAWEKYRSLKEAGTIDWTFNTILPVYIGGPNLVPTVKKDGRPTPLSLSQGHMWTIAQGKHVEQDYVGWVHVRDVATAHVQALIRPKAAEKRLLISRGRFLFGQMGKVMEEEFGIKPHPDLVTELDTYTADYESAYEILGFEPQFTHREMVKDTLNQFLD